MCKLYAIIITPPKYSYWWVRALFSMLLLFSFCLFNFFLKKSDVILAQIRQIYATLIVASFSD